MIECNLSPLHDSEGELFRSRHFLLLFVLLSIEIFSRHTEKFVCWFGFDERVRQYCGQFFFFSVRLFIFNVYIIVGSNGLFYERGECWHDGF